MARRYFDSLSAPRKAFLTLPDAGHEPNAAIIDAQYRLLTLRVRPMLK